ncbi:MAG: fasciclin domain-containing protein [Myxococcota bacterium]
MSEFATLVTALKAAGLVDTLSGEGPFTVFAPTNDAFAKLPEGALESLLKDKDALTKVLTSHVVSGKVMATDVTGMTSATVLSGVELPINTAEGVMIGEAKVTITDVEASNGVIHVIDSVILPN